MKKFIENYAFFKNATYSNQFLNETGLLVNLSGRKSTLSGPHIPASTFPLRTPAKLKFSAYNYIRYIHYNNTKKKNIDISV